jgi:hypothetical protein
LPTNDKELKGMISITQMENELNKEEYEFMEELEMGHIEKIGSMELLKRH